MLRESLSALLLKADTHTKSGQPIFILNENSRTVGWMTVRNYDIKLIQDLLRPLTSAEG